MKSERMKRRRKNWNNCEIETLILESLKTNTRILNDALYIRGLTKTPNVYTIYCNQRIS